jgi:ATP-dependent DNA ligase
MIRPIESTYVFSEKSHHSKNLLKMKPRFDAEYELVDWFMAEKGKAAGLLMLVCETTDGKLFNVTPSLTELERQEWTEKFAVVEANKLTMFENVWKGSMITVFYDDLSEDGIPLRASTKMKTRVDNPAV